MCGAIVSHFENDADWVLFYLPLEALGRTDRRIGGFPFGPEGGRESFAWRREVDDWLVSIGRQVYETAPFRRALVGFETYGEQTEQPPEVVPERRSCGHLIPHGGGLTYWAATD